MSSYSDYANAASDILLKKGEAAARAKEQTGQIWGSTIATLGQTIPKQVQDAMAAGTQRRKQAQIQSILQQAGPDLRSALPQIRAIDPKLSMDFEKELNSADEVKAKADELKAKHEKEARDFQLNVIATAKNPSQYASGLKGLHDAGFDTSPFDTEFSEDAVNRANQLLMSPDARGKTSNLVPIPGPEGKPVYGTPQPGAPVYEKPPNQSLVPVPGPDGKPVYGTPTAGAPVFEKPSGEGAGLWVLRDGKVMRVREADVLPTDQRPPADQQISPTAAMEQGNAKEVAKGLKDGTTSPEVLLSSRTTQQGMALLSELHKLGVDTDKMTREWLGTKAAIRSLDNTSQLRLAQVINKASASLDRVESLNKEWSDVGARVGIKLLNHASLKAAQNGAYGPEAASIAQRLEGQIADVTGELGQGIMGGNAPTDHALILASKNLSTDWTQKVLSDSIEQARYNLKLAQSARNEMLNQLGVQSTQFQTPPPGASTPPPAPPKVNPFR